ncbi:Glucanase [Mycena sanguinolenta]|uniref:Glucanase n=1 Tax=Mycena sanguinolenta TaxID=230812 RepID=A0A8H6TS47_9AGAR|nr:Glucanase [Mycena sanguinolenta]
MGDALQRGMVLALSLWDDYEANMLWLDSDYPLNASASAPGVARGPCATTSGVPATVEATMPNDQVIFSNIRTGPIGSTFSTTGVTTDLFNLVVSPDIPQWNCSRVRPMWWRGLHWSHRLCRSLHMPSSEPLLLPVPVKNGLSRGRSSSLVQNAERLLLSLLTNIILSR